MKVNKNSLIETLLKVAFAMAFVFLLLYQLKGRWASLIHLNNVFTGRAVYILGSVLGLMLLSLMVEAFKWRLTLRDIYTIPLLKALQSTLGGNSLSILTPNRMGEFAGRIMFLPARYRGRGAILTLIGSYSQMLCTIIGGIWALAAYAIVQVHMPWILNVGALIICTVITAILLTSYFNVGLIVPVIAQIKFLSKFQQHVSVLSVLPVKTLTNIMLLSVIKYIIFNMQYILLLQMGGNLFDAGHLLYQLPLIFFVQTAIPSFALAEVGMRSSIAIYILHATGSLLAPAFLSAALLWLINLILPSIAGGFIVLRHKFLTI